MGLEVFTSVRKVALIRDMWSKNIFLHPRHTPNVMRRNLFFPIQSAFQFYPSYNLNLTVKNPLWQRGIMLNHFHNNGTSLAVLSALISFDRNFFRCKDLPRVKTMKCKPIRFDIQFYLWGCGLTAYFFRFLERGSRNKTKVLPAVSYCSLFNELQGKLNQKRDDKLCLSNLHRLSDQLRCGTLLVFRSLLLFCFFW